jgi:hypothetical protein
VDRDRALIVFEQERPPIVWSFSKARAIAVLRKEDDGAIKLKSLELSPDGRQAITAHVVMNKGSDVDSDSDDSDRADDQYTYQNDASATSKIVLRIWDLTGQKPVIEKEKQIDLEDVKKQFGSTDIPENPGSVTSNIYFGERAIFVKIGLSNSPAGDAQYLLSRDLLELASGKPDLARGLMYDQESVFAFFADENHTLRLFNVASGEENILRDWKFGGSGRWPSATLSSDSKLLLTQQDTHIQLLEHGSSLKPLSEMESPDLQTSLLTIGDAAVGGWETQARLRLWSITGEDLGEMAGVAGSSAPVVHWNASRCEALVWTTEGRLLRFRRAWKIAGLFGIPQKNCIAH